MSTATINRASANPGTVKVIARRLIESYAGLFHTVDHVEGILADGFDSLDAFLTHMWAVTMIGAPKKWAAQAIENLEKDARGWYGGAVGMISLDGDINTGITIRTVHLRDGVAAYGAGATLLYDSIPEQEDRECHLKATGFFRVLDPNLRKPPATFPKEGPEPAAFACCWWITKTASSTRWRITRARPARKSSPTARAFRWR